MLNQPTSIKKKITLGYYLIPALIVCLSIFTLIELRFMEKRIIFTERTSEFFDTALEIRRFEKNYFLYNMEDDSKENLRYVNKALTLLSMNAEGFHSLASSQDVTELINNLSRYKVLMDYYKSSAPGDETLSSGTSEGREVLSEDKTVLEKRIRETGKQILSAAEKISKNEHRHLQKILKTSQKILLFSIVLLSFLGIVFGHTLSRMVVRSLTQVEKSLEGIAAGKFETIRIDSKDREIVSLTNAVNKMLRELELRQKYLVQSEKLASLGTLLSGVAHELNNPLSNISTSSQILMEEIEEGDMEYKKELLSQIEEQTGRAKKIVRSLLEFSRDKDFKKERLPLKKLFEETLQFLRGQIPTSIDVSLKVPESITIFADKQRIQQVFLNLIKNAVESITGEGTLFIAAYRRRSEAFKSGIYTYRKHSDQCAGKENIVNIEIQDTGSGIPSEILPKIFDPFFTTKDVGKGAGLGLAIVHDIIEEHQGCIGVESQLGKGATFLIRLPTKEN